MNRGGMVTLALEGISEIRAPCSSPASASLSPAPSGMVCGECSRVPEKPPRVPPPSSAKGALACVGGRFVVVRVKEELDG